MRGALLQRDQYAKGGIGRWYWDYRDRRTLSFIEEEKTILDVGCGEGITLERMVKKFPNRIIQGIDDSAEKVQICQNLGLPARLGNVYELAFNTESFDCCLLLEVIEHLQDPSRAFAEIRRVLKKGGLLLLIFPNDVLFKAARLCFFKFAEAFAPSGHVRQWIPGAMERALDENGFEVQEKLCLPFGFWWISLHCLVVARKK
jgi:2-polyprenyl-3-methyl-5-hydroxy-6-metoxy-1,4-benzoquinol methylase